MMSKMHRGEVRRYKTGDGRVINNVISTVLLMGLLIVNSFLLFSIAKPQSVNAYELDGVVNVQPDFAIYVNKLLNCVTVYSVDAEGAETPVKSMVCSCGRQGHGTPSGTFKLQEGYEWRLMVDNTWAQYAVRFNNHILFHSVPYIKAKPDTLETDQYNLLGSPASLGCVRLSVEDAKWIYDNVKRGTKIVVYEDDAEPGPLGKPEAIKLDENDPRSVWDPTDPDTKNPWNF